MKYIGEHLFPGQLGHFLLILSLVASLLATIAFYKANTIAEITQKNSWLKLGRIFFMVETIAVIGVFAVLYYIISNHLFEYKYAWQHSDKSLQFEYVLSCFWEGQEGSFLLWSFWHCVLGWVLIYTSKQWQAGVMVVVSFAQFCLATMVIGLFFFDKKIGSNPFALLRNEMDAPIFARENYLSFIKDGTGLNALLQNYWMVIHPPILFLGFASTIVPFAFCYAGLKNNDNNWVKPALPWASFSAAVLGTGIMMGAMWAYESLSFGGYWAWDPVENASLVPWLTLIAGLHTNIIYKNTGYSLRSTYFFYIVTFILILYSTFLTRSGVLGDTSVHAFTDLGMNFQLLAFVLVFLIPIFYLFIKKYKTIPAIVKEENTYSREFWMFIGSLVLFLSGFVISFITSLPLFNKIVQHVSFLQPIFKQAFSQPEDAEFTHNQIQIFVAIVLGLLTAITQYLKYKDTPKSYTSNKLWLTFLVSLSIALLIVFVGKVNYDKKGIGFMIAIHVAIFSAVYAVVANAGYIWLVLKGKVKAAGASVAHIGFGLLLLGVLISSGKKTIVSWNKTDISPLKANEKENPLENTTLFKGIATDMGNYMVTYLADSINPRDRKQYFTIKFEAKNASKETFYLYPDLIKNNKGADGMSNNPDAKHYLTKDIFAYITYFKEDDSKDTTSYKNTPIKIGDTVFYSNGFMVLKNILKNPTNLKAKYANEPIALFLDIDIISKDSGVYNAKPGIALSDKEGRLIADTVLAQGLILKVNKLLNAQTNSFEISYKENQNTRSIIALKVLEFPMIKFVWLGVVIMVIGFIMSIRQRIKQLR